MDMDKSLDQTSDKSPTPPETQPVTLIRREYLPWLNRADPNYQMLLAAWRDPRNQQLGGVSTFEQMLMDARV
ncbi:MAG: hypothetical protein C4321_07210, partial [Chloroflexota bacterium]